MGWAVKSAQVNLSFVITPELFSVVSENDGETFKRMAWLACYLGDSCLAGR